VHRYIQRRAGVEAADEIAAETFLVAFDNRSKFHTGQPDACPWLLGIATNLLRRTWRAEQRQLKAYARSLEQACDTGLSSSDPSEAYAGHDLARALCGLNRDDRDALLLFVWADLSYRQIADALAVPIGTVRSRIARARRQLRQRLEPRPRGRSHSPFLHRALTEETLDG
jgi:RNA polymerase sigma factor (sigma-70 family)